MGQLSQPINNLLSSLAREWFNISPCCNALLQPSTCSLLQSKCTIHKSDFLQFSNHMWPSATKWGSLRGVSKLRKVLHCNKHYFLHILMSKSMISFKITSQRFGLSKIVICDFVCTSMGQSSRKCSITRLFFHIFIEKSVLNDCVWYDEDLD